jgi:magnesium-transporting ATPase (P-type)
MLMAPFLGMPLPLLPRQILWINLTTDGLPALTLNLEPAERGTSQVPHILHLKLGLSSYLELQALTITGEQK